MLRRTRRRILTMKKKVAVLLGLCVMACSLSQGAVLVWNDDNGDGFFPVGGDSNSGPAQNGWQVILVRDSDGTPGFQWGSDATVQTTSLGDLGNGGMEYGETYSSPTPGATYYVVVVNGPDAGSASWYVVTGRSPYTTGNPMQEPFEEHNFGGDAQTPWLPVPEPGAWALFGLGLAAVMARRKFKA
jgi:hypothetical protein